MAFNCTAYSLEQNVNLTETECLRFQYACFILRDIDTSALNCHFLRRVDQLYKFRQIDNKDMVRLPLLSLSTRVLKRKNLFSRKFPRLQNICHRMRCFNPKNHAIHPASFFFFLFSRVSNAKFYLGIGYWMDFDISLACFLYVAHMYCGPQTRNSAQTGRGSDPLCRPPYYPSRKLTRLSHIVMKTGFAMLESGGVRSVWEYFTFSAFGSRSKNERRRRRCEPGF
jgi:hypothetical protein